MKKTQIVGALIAIAISGGTGVLAGCGSTDSPESSAQAQTSATPATSTPATPAPATPASSTVATKPGPAVVLAPGQAGPVKVGMSKAEASATGLFDVDVDVDVAGCPVRPLTWKQAYSDALDVQTLKNGEVASIGVRGQGPKTQAGLGIGSSLAEVFAQYPRAKTVAAGYGQTGVLVQGSNEGWIGFLFNPEPQDVKSTSKVSFIELTSGEKPSLIRDGC